MGRVLAFGTTTKSNSGTSPKSGKGKKQINDSRLEEFFHDELKDIYWAEKHLVKTLPKLAKAASAEDLKAAFTEHLDVTKDHVVRLEKVFEILGEQPHAKNAMRWRE